MACNSRFPDANSSIIAALLSPSKDLISMQADLAQVVMSNGIELDSRPYLPHITLARLKRGSVFDFPSRDISLPIHCSEVVLYTSELTGEGSHYKALRSFGLF